MSTKIDERVTILDEHDRIAAARGYDPADYKDIKVRRYVVETPIAGFSFSVDERGDVVTFTRPQRLIPGVDVL